MGESKRKKARFLSTHQNCCFCGGGLRATTIDHVPPRTCFPDRLAPEGFEFPACAHCQSATRLDELVIGFYIKLSDPDDSNFREAEFERALQGLKNNMPHLTPQLDLSSRDKRRSIAAMGLEKPPGILAKELPLAAIPEEVHAHIVRYAHKMACAIYYREQERIASRDHCVWATWTHSVHRHAMEALDPFVKMTPLVTTGTRRNVSIGNMFGYRCNKADDPDVLAALAQFGSGMILAMVIVDPDSKARLTDAEDWVKVSDIFDGPRRYR